MITRTLLCRVLLLLALAGCHSVVGLDELEGTEPMGDGWALHFRGANQLAITAVAMDAQGNIIVAGQLEGVMDFGVGQLVATQGRDLFIVKLGPDGSLLWSKLVGDPFDGKPTSIAVTPRDDIVVAGFASGHVDFGDGVEMDAIGDDAFVVKLGAGGNALWIWQAAGEGPQRARDVAVSDVLDEEVWVVGNFEREISIDVGGQVSTTVSAGEWDGFMARISTLDGRTLDRWTYGDETDQHVAAIETIDDTPVIAGTNAGTMMLGDTALVSHGSSDMFLARLERDGAHRLSASFGDEQPNCFDWCELDLLVGPTGEIVLAGAYSGAADFGGGPLTTALLADGFVAAFDMLGAGGAPVERFSFIFGDTFEQRLYGVTAYGEQYLVSGLFNGTFDLGGHELADQGAFGKDSLVAAVDVDGATSWVETVATSSSDRDPDDRVGTRVAAHADHGVVIVGAFRGELQVAGGTLTSEGDFDGFVVKLRK